MKKIFIVSLLFLLHNLAQGQEKNPLLNRDFWKKNPSITTIQKLVEKGYSLSDTDSKGFDPTTLAILQEANNSVILYLLQDPKNPINKITHDKRTYLHWASLKGNIALVKFLIDSGADLNALDDKGMSALTFAASNGQASTELYQVFFQKGIDIKKTYSDGTTILHLAIAADKDLKLCNYLISKGLSLKDTDNKKRTLIDYASLGGNISIMKKLHQMGVSFTPYTLIWAAKGTKKHQNSIEVFQYALEELKLPINAVDDNGKTALHYIANKNQQNEIISYLLQHHADTNIADNDGNTPFLISCSAKATENLKILLPKVTHLNHTNKKGENALSLALLNGSAQSVSLLLKEGIDTHFIDKKGNPLAYFWIASYAKNKEDFFIKENLLKQFSIDLFATSPDGNSLIHWAVAQNNLELIKYIYSIGIDINLKNKQGETPLHIACMKASDTTILDYLLSIGADKTIQTAMGELPYDLALENEFLKNITINFLKP